MSHLGPEAKGRHRLSHCRKGRHVYGPSQSVGAGIERQVCRVCNDVTIDLTQAVASVNTPVLTKRRSFTELKVRSG